MPFYKGIIEKLEYIYLEKRLLNFMQKQNKDTINIARFFALPMLGITERLTLKKSGTPPSMRQFPQYLMY